MNTPKENPGIIAVCRGCFPIAHSTRRCKNSIAAYGGGIYACPVTGENEKDAPAAHTENPRR